MSFLWKIEVRLEKIQVNTTCGFTLNSFAQFRKSKKNLGSIKSSTNTQACLVESCLTKNPSTRKMSKQIFKFRRNAFVLQPYCKTQALPILVKPKFFLLWYKASILLSGGVPTRSGLSVPDLSFANLIRFPDDRIAWLLSLRAFKASALGSPCSRVPFEALWKRATPSLHLAL